jgi:two-component system, NarL family, response regulator YdfI
MIRILVKAQTPVARAGLESLLAGHPGFQIVRNSSSGDSMPEPDAPLDAWVVEAETLADPPAREAINWGAAGGPVILLLRNPTAEIVAEALRSGARAVLPSNATAPQIAAAIEAAAAGLVAFHDAGIEALLGPSGAAVSRSLQSLVEPLTPREIEVLKLVAAGLGNKEIAARLNISDHTVKFHLTSVMGKLGASSRTEAVTLGIRHGLIMI